MFIALNIHIRSCIVLHCTHSNYFKEIISITFRRPRVMFSFIHQLHPIGCDWTTTVTIPFGCLYRLSFVCPAFSSLAFSDAQYIVYSISFLFLTSLFLWSH